MTAAIPPACCAGAEDGQFLAELDRFRDPDRGGAGIFPARAVQCGVRAIGTYVVLDLDVHFNLNLDSHVDINLHVDIDFHLNFHFDVYFNLDFNFHFNIDFDVNAIDEVAGVG
jgi:hypothetical protein